MIDLGYTPDDILTDTLPLAWMVAIISASPPGTAVRWALDEGWTREAHLLANLAEQWSGLTDLGRRHPRPGVPETQSQANRATRIDAKPGQIVEKVQGFDSMTIEEWEAHKAKNWAMKPPRRKG